MLQWLNPVKFINVKICHENNLEMIIIRLNQCVRLCTDIYRYIRTFVYMHRARGDILGKDSTYVYICTCKHNYTYKVHTQRRQVTVAPACRTGSRRVLLDNAPVDGRTNGQTHIYRLLSCPRKKQGLRYRLR